MATVNLFFDKRHTNKSGLIPILYKLSHKNQMTTWTTGYSARECEYNGDDNAFLNRKNPKYKSINSELYQNLLNYRKLISENTSTIKNMLVVELKNFILYGKKSEPTKTDFFEYAEEYINMYSGGTKKLYERTLDMLRDYLKKDKLKFDDVTVGMLRSIDHEWSKSQSINTRGIYFRCMRTIFNRAIDDEICSNYPFLLQNNSLIGTAHKHLPALQELIKIESLYFPRILIFIF